MKGVNFWRLQHLIESATSNSTEINGKCVPCRPIGWDSIKHRIKAAWLAFTGQADVVIWPEGQ